MTVRHKVGILATAFFALSLLLCQPAAGQSFWPKNLGKTVNSECPEVNPVLSHGGDTLFFSRINCAGNGYGAEDSQDIWMSVKQEDGSWGEAQRLPETVNIGRYNALLSALDDGKTFLISGIFDKPGKQWLRRGFSFITCEEGTWSAPQRIKMRGLTWRHKGDLMNAHMTPDGRFLVFATSPNWAGKNLRVYISERKDTGVYTRPKRVRGPIEEFHSAEAPFYDTCQGRLYFAAKKKNEELVNNDIYYVEIDSVKNRQKKTSLPVYWKNLTRLSDTVNTTQWESYFYPHPAGTFAMLCSNKDGYGRSDIYKVMLVEERPWVRVHGRILNKKTGKLFPIDKEPKVQVNGAPSDSVMMNPDTASFLAFMPLGEKYAFTAAVPYFYSDTVIVDVSNDRLYSEREIDIHLTSVPYVQVTGRILNNLSLTGIPAMHKPTVLVNGKTVDSLKVNSSNSTYTVHLPFGEKYKMGAKAIEFQNMDNELDLTQYSEYTTVKHDVFARPLNANMVTLRGRLINTKTGKPLEPGIEAKMRVNRVLSDAFQYNTKNATYKMLLPAGADYDLVPSVKNFYNKLEVVDLRKAKARTVVPRDFYVTPLEVGQSVDIENIYFETGKSKLKPQSFRSLNALVDFFREYPNVKVEIGGHTDNTGSIGLNRRLSKARARAVADYIIEQGIGQERFQAVGHGPDKPKASNKTAKGRAKNRRVDFTIMGI